MIYRFFVPLRLPSLNEYTNAERTSRYAAAKMKAAAELAIILTAKRAFRGVSLRFPVFIAYTWHEKDMRRDKDNIAFAKKFVQDALVKVQILPNDGWAHISGFSDKFCVKPSKVGVEVEVYDCDEN